MCFNPHPARRPGAALLEPPETEQRCFNPHPARRPGAASQIVRASRNTVQLGIGCLGDRELGWPSWLRPCPVSGAFDVPLDVFALDDPRIGPLSPCGVEASHEERDGVPPAVLSALRGKNRATLGSSGGRYAKR